MMIVYVSSMHVPLGFRGSPQIKFSITHTCTYTMYMHVNSQVHVYVNIRTYMHMYLYTNSR